MFLIKAILFVLSTGDCKNGAFSTAKEKSFADESIKLSINDNSVK